MSEVDDKVAKEMERYGAKACLREGVMRAGKFSKAEDNLILEHITEFCADKGITPDEMIPEMRDANTTRTHTKKSMKEFLNQLAAIIPERKRAVS